MQVSEIFLCRIVSRSAHLCNGCYTNRYSQYLFLSLFSRLYKQLSLFLRCTVDSNYTAIDSKYNFDVVSDCYIGMKSEVKYMKLIIESKLFKIKYKSIILTYNRYNSKSYEGLDMKQIYILYIRSTTVSCNYLLPALQRP